MGFFSRKKPSSKVQSPQPPPTDSTPSTSSRSSSPALLPPRPSTSSSSHRYGSTTSLPPNLPSLSIDVQHQQHKPEEPYILPSLSLSPLGLSPMRSRASSSSDGRRPGGGSRQSSFLAAGSPPQEVLLDEDDQPLGLRGGKSASRGYFGLGKADVVREGQPTEERSSSFRFQDASSPIGGSSRGVAGEQERFIKGTYSPPSSSTTSKKIRSPLPPPLLSFDPPPQPQPSSNYDDDQPNPRRVSSSLLDDDTLPLDPPRSSFYGDDGVSSSTSSHGKGKKRFMGMFGASKESLVSLNAAGGSSSGEPSTGNGGPSPRSTSPLPSTPSLAVPPHSHNHNHVTSPLAATYSSLPVATPRPQRPSAPIAHRTSSFLNVLKIGSSRNSHHTRAPSPTHHYDNDEDDGLPLRPPSPASSFRVISARHITTPPPASTEELMATPALRPVFPPRGRSQSGDWRNSSALVDDDEDEEGEETMVEERKVSVAVFRRRQSEVGLNGAGSTGLELDLGASKSGIVAGQQVSSTVERGRNGEERTMSPPPLNGEASVSPPPASSFARNKGFIVASRQSRSISNSIPSSSSSSIHSHSEESRPPPRSSSLSSFSPPSPNTVNSSPVETINPTARPNRPPRASTRPLSSPPSSPVSAYHIPQAETRLRRPSSNFFPLNPNYAPSPIEDHSTSHMLPLSQASSRIPGNLPPPPAPVSTQPVANSPKPISRYNAAKASKPPPPPAPALKPVARRHYSSTEEDDSSESSASSEDDDTKRRRDRTGGSRTSFSSNKTFTRGSSSGPAGDRPSRSKSPSASMFSASGNRRVVGKPLMQVEGVEKPVLDRRSTIRRKSTADIDGAVVEEKEKREQREQHTRRGSESVLTKMAPMKPRPAGDDDSSDGYGQDDPNSLPRSTSQPSPAAIEDTEDDDDKPLGLRTRAQSSISPAGAPSINLPSPPRSNGRQSSSTTTTPSSQSQSPSKSNSSSSLLGLRNPTSQPFLGRGPPPSRSASSLSASTSISSASSSSQPTKPILRPTTTAPSPSAPSSLLPNTNISSSSRPPSSFSSHQPIRSPISPNNLTIKTTPVSTLPSPPATGGTNSAYSSNPNSPLPLPPTLAGSSLNRSAASPSSSLTGDSSSGRTPLTPREGGERARERERSALNGVGGAKRWGGDGKPREQETVPLKPIDEDEKERRRNERRRGEARNAIELGNVFHGPPPPIDDPDSDQGSDSPPNDLPPNAYQNPFALPNNGYPPQFGVPGGNPFGMGGGMGGMGGMTETWALQAQIQAQQAQMMAMQMAMQAQMGGGDPAMHYQTMMMAKQQFQSAMAAQAAQLAGDQWEMSSNFGGAMSDAGGGSVRGGGGGGGGGMGGMMGFPGMMMGGFGGGYASSAYGGGGGGSNWGGGSEAGWGGGGGGARSEYGGARSEYGGGGGGGGRTRHTSGSGLGMMQQQQQQQRQSSFHPSPPLSNQLRSSPSEYFARNPQENAPSSSSTRPRQVSQPANTGSSNGGRPPPTSRSSSSFFSLSAQSNPSEPQRPPQPTREDREREREERSRQPRRSSKPTSARPLSIIAPPSRPFVDEEIAGGGARSEGRSTPPTSWRAGSPVGGRR